MNRRMRYVAVVLMSLVPLSGCGPSNDIPAGCEDLFDGGEFSCGTPNDSAPCDETATDPNRVFDWMVRFHEDGPSVSNLKRKVECVSAHLRAKGLDPTTQTDRTFFHVHATHPQMETLCRTTMVGRCSPGMLAGECETLDEEGCAATRLCSEYRGALVDADRGCYHNDVFAVCIERSCEDAPAEAAGPDSTCWAFSTGCYPVKDGWSVNRGDCPSPDDVWSMPECDPG